MKYRAAIFFSLILILAFQSPAQERKFDITIAIDGGSSRIDRGEAVLKARITNRGAGDLRTSGLGELNIYFSSCQPGDPSCGGDAFHYASYWFPGKTVMPERSTEFVIDLSDLSWKRGPYNKQSSAPSSAFSAVPSKNIYLYADVKIFDGFSVDPASGRRAPKYREFLSNVINVSFR